MITIEHQDGNMKYEFSKGGFCLENSRLYFSIEGTSDDDEIFPPSCLFAVSGFPINKKDKTFSFELKDNPDYETPYACFYTTFHSSEVSSKVEIEFMSDDEIKVSFSVLSDDVNYYNEKAKPNLTKGLVRLERRELKDLLIPS